MQKRVALSPGSPNCSSCALGHVCVPIGMAEADVRRLEELVQERVRLPKGATLYAQSDTLDAVYSVRYGCLKTQIGDAGGHLQITGFHLPGEMVGLDGMLEGRHVSTATALEDSEVCVIRLSQIDHVAAQLPSLEPQMRRLMSRELTRSFQFLASVGGMRAEQRLASFLLDLSRRYGALGYSATAFLLRMSREEIGNHLGLTLETTSRLFSKFARENLIAIKQRELKLLDIPGLRQRLGREPS